MPHKCFRCGTEFEGNFCPECGTKWEENKTCPQCGALLPGNAKFCNTCGHSFLEASPAAPFAPVKPAAPQPGLVRLYAICRYLPTVLLAIFPLLLFLLCLAPAAVMPGGEFLGESIPSESFGNVYEMLSGDIIPALQGCCIALILFASLAAACVLLYFLAWYFTMNIDSARWLRIAGYLSLFAIFIVSCAMFIVIGNEDGGMGMLAAGSAPILILVFSLISMLLAAGAVCLHAHWNKTEIAKEYQRKKKEKEQAEAARRQEFTSKHPAPVAPEKMEKPSAVHYRDTVPEEERAALMPVMTKYFRTKWLLVGVFCLLLSLFVTMFSIFLGRIADDDIEIWPFIVGLGLPLAIILLGILAWNIKNNKKTWAPWEVYKTGMLIFIAVMLFVMAFYSIAPIKVATDDLNRWSKEIAYYSEQIKSGHGTDFDYDMLNIYNIGYGHASNRLLGYWITVAVEAAFALICSVLWVQTLIQHIRLSKKLCGFRKPQYNRDLEIQYWRERKEFRPKRKFYRQNVREWNIYRYQVARYQKQKLYDSNTKYSRVWVFVHRRWLAGGAVLLAGVITLTCVLATMDRRFSTDNLIEIGLDADEKKVEEVLGEPDAKLSDVWSYYSKNYASILDEMQELEEKSKNAASLSELAELSKQYDKLEKELETIEYQVIVVRFSDTEYGRKADFLSLDTCAVDKDEEEKEVEDIVLRQKGYSYENRYSLSSGNPLTYAITYKDGSYRTGYFSSSQLPTKKGDQTITWSDEWGSYTKTIEVS